MDLSLKEIGTIKCALVRYKDFCENCISAFKGTGHDEYYKGRLAEADELLEKIYNETTKE